MEQVGYSRDVFFAFVTEFEHTPEGRQLWPFDAWHAALTRYITGRLVPNARCPEGQHVWVGPATGATHCARCHQPRKELPVPRDVAECHAGDRHAPYQIDLAGINDAAAEAQG